MRRESSTVVVLVGDVTPGLLADLAKSPNVSIARAPAEQPARPGAAESEVSPGWERGALAMAEAARRRSTYVIVPDDPLAEVAAQWRAMWELSTGPGGAGFELSAADALAAWHAKRFELPDYYLVIAKSPAEAPTPRQPLGPSQPSDDVVPDFYLGPLRSVRPRRVAVAGIGIAVAGLAARPGQAAALLNTLRALEHGPWWPPLDDLIEVARYFYAAALTTTT